jgi:hypothetical protein
MSYFQMYRNHLTGCLPPSFRNWSRVRSFVLRGNAMRGTLPPEYSAWVRPSNTFSWKPTGTSTAHFQRRTPTGRRHSHFLSMGIRSAGHCRLSTAHGGGSSTSKWTPTPSPARCLRSIAVNENYLNGSLSSAWGAMGQRGNLVSLNVNLTCLEGAVPPSYASISTLTTCGTRIVNRSVGCSVLLDWPAYCTSASISATTSQLLLRDSTSQLLLSDSTSRPHPSVTDSTNHSAMESDSGNVHAPALVLVLAADAGAATRSATCTLPDGTLTVSPLRRSPSLRCSSSSSNATLLLHAPLQLPAQPREALVAVLVADAVAATRLATNGSVQVEVVQVVTNPVVRSVLVLGPELACNLTFLTPAAAGRWSATRVTAFGEGGVAVQLTWSMVRSVEASSVTWFVLAVQPPGGSGVWLPRAASPLVSQTIILEVTFACGGDDVLIVRLLVPAPGYPAQLASQVETATRYSQVASALAGGASSGAALGRVMAMRSMVVCDADAAVGGGVLDFGLELCPASSSVDAARRAVVSNVVVLASVIVLLVLVSCAWARARGAPARAALLVFSAFVGVPCLCCGAAVDGCRRCAACCEGRE